MAAVFFPLKEDFPVDLGGFRFFDPGFRDEDVSFFRMEVVVPTDLLETFEDLDVGVPTNFFFTAFFATTDATYKTRKKPQKQTILLSLLVFVQVLKKSLFWEVDFCFQIAQGSHKVGIIKANPKKLKRNDSLKIAA
ncbi:hypothetical protein [Leptospira alstonii]|nr:hypothetical protein [Leptospira alstonii]EMJ97649.1 hypothetical protein LEP1GSC194_2969 [Leptospira alstonii serovar Sichuan str. 79601]